MLLYSILSGDTTTSGSGASTGSDWVTYVLLGVIVVAIIAMFVVSSRRNKKRQEEADKLINAVRPGNKVKTIGGVCGIVVEVDDEENTFVLETGTEASGKSYMKFDKQAIYQTDAVVESDVKDDKDDKKKEEEEKTEEISAQPQSAEEAKAEEPAETSSEEK